MKRVEPIRDTDDIERMKDYLLSKNERNYLLIMCGLYSGLRISDILPLQVKDVQGDRIQIVEMKTRKAKSFPINKELRRALDRYIKHNELKSYDYLFKSRKKKRANGVRRQHIGRVAAYQIFKDAAEYVGLENIGTHSMRKTFGYHFYNQTGDVVKLMKLFNHATPEITLAYIGFTQDELDEAMLDFKY